MELEELQLQIDEMKKMIEEDTELPKRNKLRIDSIQLEIKKIKEDIEKPIGLVVPPTNKPFETVAESNASADKKALAEEQSKNGAAKKAEKISPFKIGTVDADGVRIISKKDFKDSNGTEIKAGYYIVVGTFFYKEYAMAEIKRFKERGFTNTSFIFYEPLHYHYIYANYLTSKEESLAILKKLREAETEVCLLLNVTE